MEKIFHSINGEWVGFVMTNGRGGVSRRKVERELVKGNQGGLDMGSVEGPRSADDAPAWRKLEAPCLEESNLTDPLIIYQDANPESNSLKFHRVLAS